VNHQLLVPRVDKFSMEPPVFAPRALMITPSCVLVAQVSACLAPHQQLVSLVILATLCKGESVHHVPVIASVAPQLLYAQLVKKAILLTVLRPVLPMLPPISLQLSALQVLQSSVQQDVQLVFRLSSVPHAAEAIHYHHLCVSLAMKIVLLVLPTSLKYVCPASLESTCTRGHVSRVPIHIVWSAPTITRSAPSANMVSLLSKESVKPAPLTVKIVTLTELAYAMWEAAVSDTLV